MINVVMADDHAVVRTGLQLYYNVNSGISISGEAASGNELIHLLKYNSYDVAVVDLNMPGRDSLDLIAEVMELSPNLPVVVFSMNKDEQLMQRLIKLGIKAFINKEENPEELTKAIKAAAENRVYLTDGQKHIFMQNYLFGNKEVLPHQKLTDREYQIMCLLAQGKSKDFIAAKLQISKNTINNHRNSILKKLQVSNNAELTRYALNNSLIN